MSPTRLRYIQIRYTFCKLFQTKITPHLHLLVPQEEFLVADSLTLMHKTKYSMIFYSFLYTNRIRSLRFKHCDQNVLCQIYAYYNKDHYSYMKMAPQMICLTMVRDIKCNRKNLLFFSLSFAHNLQTCEELYFPTSTNYVYTVNKDRCFNSKTYNEGFKSRILLK